MPDRDDTAGYSIKAVARATGLSAETLRAWERRYGLIEPRRDRSGRRIYSARDVARLRRLRETTERGHPIGKIAHLSNDDLSLLIAETQGAAQDAAAARSFAARLLRAVERYQPTEYEQTLAMAFALLPPAVVVRRVLSPALIEVGDRWERGALTIAQEHIASSGARRELTTLLSTWSAAARGPAVVFATPSGERHELGILMHAALAASQLLRAYYPGPDLPAEEIASYARRVGAVAVALSLVMSAAIDSFLAQLAALRRLLPAEIEIWIGGPAARRVAPVRLPRGCLHLREPEDFDARVELLRRRDPG